MLKTLIGAGSAVVFACVAFSAQADPASNTDWAATSDDGGLGGAFVLLNSNGINPFSIPDAWTIGLGYPNVVFSTDLGSAGVYTNTPSWNGSDYTFPFGVPDTTSYGETFVAPAGASISTFDFLVANSGPGTDATFVLATWDPVNKRADKLLFSTWTFLQPGGFFDPNTNSLPDIKLTAGETYVAFLTVAAVPEPSTWALMGLGFGALGLAALRSIAKPGGNRVGAPGKVASARHPFSAGFLEPWQQPIARTGQRPVTSP